MSSLLATLATAGACLAATPGDSGTFVLHKLGNPIGRETWRVVPEAGGGRRLTSAFSFTDRGTAVPLDAELAYAADGRPVRFTLKGRTSRWSAVDLAVTVAGDSAEVREGGAVTTVPLAGAFPAHGYAGPNGIGLSRAATTEQGVAWVRRYHDAGLEQIKVYSSVPPGVLAAITAEAHALGMTVTGHVPRGLDGYEGVAAGMDQLNHATFILRMMRAAGDSTPLAMDAPEARRAVTFLAEHRIVVDPTLALYELNLRPASEPVHAFEPGADKVAPELRAALEHTGVDPARAEPARTQYRTLLALVGALHRAGVPIVAGTDLAVPGHSLHRELELYVEAGFTPMEAIQSATLQAARAMRLEHESGTLRPGLRADVLVVDGNPLARISDTRKVRFVIANGRRFDPAPLWRSVGFTP